MMTIKQQHSTSAQLKLVGTDKTQKPSLFTVTSISMVTNHQCFDPDVNIPRLLSSSLDIIIKLKLR